MHVYVGGAAAVGQSNGGHQVVFVAVHTTRREKPHDMDGAAPAYRGIDRIEVGGVAVEIARLDGVVDARHVLVDHPARAEAHMAHLRVSHLPFGQAHIPPRPRYEGVRRIGPQPIPDRRVGVGDCVVAGVFAVAPAIQDDQ